MNQQQQIYYWAHMLDEAFCKEQFLCEDREGKNINRAEKWIKQNHPELIGKEINGRTMSRARDVVTQIRHDIPSARLPYDKDANGQLIKVKLSNGDIVDKGTCKYLPGVCRIYLNDLPSKTSDQAQLVKLTARLSDLVNVIGLQFDNDFSDNDQGRDFNGMTFDELEAKYGKHIDELKRREREEAKSSLGNTKKNEDYTIVSIESFDDAEEFSQYVSWCITQEESYFDDYTAKGENKFYFAIRKDFKTVPKDDPSYATSMLAILVNADGSMDSNNGCTSRLNNGGRFMDPKQVQDLLGVDFYKTFKPDDTSTIWRKILKKRIPLRDLYDEFAKFCKTFDCIAVYDYVDSSTVFKKLIDGKIVTLPYVDNTTTFINNKFVTMKDGKFVDIALKTIQHVPKNIKGDFAIPDGVTSIGDSAFYECSDLTSVTIPDSVTSIETYAFGGCESLTSVTIPSSVTSIGYRAFSDCSRLTNVMIPNSVTTIGHQVFYNCTSLTSVTIPDGVTSIGSWEFYCCTSLTSITIPDSVTTIVDHAFSNCNSLTSVTIPESVTSIGKYVFSDCTSLTSLTIPDSVTSIGNNVFYHCDSLKSLVFKGKTFEEVKAMQNYPFGIKDELIIKCESSLNESKATYLQKYRDEADAKKIVDAFWQIKSRLSAPQNDIDWWIKKPFADLKSFVLNYSPANKKQRRDADYRKQALENDAKLLDTRDGYEIWYVPTYEAMRILGRFYKGRSAKWCVASDDPEFWFDNHDEDEFVVLVREQPKNDEFDKVAIQMMDHGRYYNEDDIIPWDLENDDWTFTDDDLMHEAWLLFKDNGELRERYYDVD